MAERELVARIAAQLEPSPIRRMARYLTQPEMISLAGGVPDPQTFPLAEVEEAFRRVLATAAAGALQYGTTRGWLGLRERLAEQLVAAGVPASAETVMVTAGSQQALDLVGRLFIDPGDTVIVETPTYVGALAAFRAAGARFRALAAAGAEPDPGEVDRAVLRARAAGSVAKLLYLVPNFQNPAGTTLTPAARAGLLAAAARNRLAVIEDDPYRELWFDQPPPPPLASLGSEAPLVYLGSLSKVLAPGLRLGYLTGPETLLERLERLKEATDLCTGSLVQAIAAELIAAGVVARGLVASRALYRRRRDAMVAALAAALPAAASFTRPGGGFFTWLELPGVDAAALLERALEAGLAFVVGAPFHAEGGGASTLRLAFSRESEERIAEGVGRLGRLLAAGP